MQRTDEPDLHPLIWLWCLPLPLLIHLGMRQIDRDGIFFSKWIESESGLIENATAILLIPATVFAIKAAIRGFRHYGSIRFFWFFALAIVCFGFAGEEVSWGQHWLGWTSPEYFVEHNRQGETNFHNLNIHFGRIVKSILTLAIIVGGLIMPFALQRRLLAADATPRYLDIITPSRVCVPAAMFVLGVRLIERFKTWFDLDWPLIAVNLKELQELYIAIFLLFYAWSAFIRYSTDARASRV